MTDNNRLLKRLLPGTVRYVTDNSGNKTGFESYDRKLTVTPGNSAPMGSCAWSNIMGRPSTFPTTWDQIADRPPMFDGTWGSLADKPNLFSGRYSDLLNRPDLSPLASSGDYSDIKNKPPMFSGAYADLTGLPALFDGKWASVTGKPATYPSTWTQVADKPALFSGSYSDLINKPTLFDGAWASLTGKPALFSGSYNDLADKPAIPIMPSLATVASTGSYNDLSNKPTLFNGTWASLTGKPTTLAGFGITDAVTGAALTSALGNYTTTSALTALLASKADASAVKRIDTYTGTTDANGLFTVTFTTPFAAIPTIQPEPLLLGSQVWVKVSSSTTGFSLRLMQRNSASVLGLELLLAAMVNVSGATVRVAVIAQ